MKVEVGNFVFLDDKFYKDFPAEQHGLMSNGEGSMKRPFFFVADTRQGIYWLVPISSRIQKYEELYKSRVEKFGKCYTIAFADINGAKNVFLLQNMFPVTEEYISQLFMIDGKPACVHDDVKKAMKTKFNDVLDMARRGRKVIFPDALGMEKTLLARMGVTIKPPAIKPQARGKPTQGKPPPQLGG